jgi:hypothetical protein
LGATNSAATIDDFDGGSYASPAAWGSSHGFGYTSDDTSIQGTNLFNAASCAGGGAAPCYAPFSHTLPGDIVADHTATVSGSPVTDEAFTVTLKTAVDSSQAAGSYLANLIYTITATY